MESGADSNANPVSEEQALDALAILGGAIINNGELKQKKSLLNPNPNEMNGLPIRRSRIPHVRTILDMEEFEKPVDVTERLKEFNFNADDEETMMNTTLTSQQGSMTGDLAGRVDQGYIDHLGENENQNNAQNSGNTQVDQQAGKGKDQKAGSTDFDGGYSRGNLDENDLEVKYRDDHRYSKIKWIIFPDDDFRQYWDVVIALNLLYTATVVPYTVAFVENTSTVNTVIDAISDCIWGIDIIITFMSAYEDREDNLIVSRRKIALNYIFGWFFLDALSITPFDIFLNIDKSFNSLLRIAKLPKLARFLRLARLARMLRFMKEGSKVARYFHDWLKLRPGVDRFFMTMVFFCIFCHIASCIWYMQATLNEHNPTNWINENNLSDDTSLQKYVVSTYFIIATVVTVGYGDIHASNTFERIVAIFLMFLGAFFYSFIIGSLSSVILNLDSRKRILEKKINTLIEIRQRYSLDNDMFNKIKRVLKFGYARDDQDKLHFLNDLPVSLRTKLSVVMHKDMLKHITFFKARSDRFLATIGPLLKEIKIGINEYIFTEGEYANEMYFIKSGTVQMVIKEFNNFPFMYIEQGYYFGEIDLLFSETRKHSYHAKTECILLSLSKKNFTKVFFQDFREYGAEIYNNALKRKVRAQHQYKEALNQCKASAREKTKRKSKFIPQVSVIPHIKGIAGSVPKAGESVSDESAKKLDPLSKTSVHTFEELDKVENKEGQSKEQSSISKTEKDLSKLQIEGCGEDNNAKVIGSKGSKIEDEKCELSPTEVEDCDQNKPLDLNPIPLKAANKFAMLAKSLGQNKFLSKGATPKLGNFALNPEAASSNLERDQQLQNLYQRVDQLEKSIERILELYQTHLAGEEL